MRQDYTSRNIQEIRIKWGRIFVCNRRNGSCLISPPRGVLLSKGEKLDQCKLKLVLEVSGNHLYIDSWLKDLLSPEHLNEFWKTLNPGLWITLREGHYNYYEISWIVFGLGTLCVKEGETGHLTKMEIN